MSTIEEDGFLDLDPFYEGDSIICVEEEEVINDNGSISVQPDEVDELTWGVDWIDAERVWGGVEDAQSVVSDNPSGLDIKVGVIDTGIDHTHPDLNDNYVSGIDYVNDDNNPMDGNGHARWMGNQQ